MFSIKESLRYGWGIFKENIPFWIGLVLLVWGSLFVLQAAVDYLLPESKSMEVTILSVLWGLVLQILSILLQMGALYIALEFFDGRKPRLKDISAPWSRFLPYLGGALLYGLIVLAGTILFIVPGIYLAMRYYFTLYLILDRHLGPIEALKKSAEITQGTKWKLFVFSVVTALIGLAGFLALGIGLFVAIPVTLMASVYVYRTVLKKQEGEADSAVPSPESPAPSNMEEALSAPAETA